MPEPWYVEDMAPTSRAAFTRHLELMAIAAERIAQAQAKEAAAKQAAGEE